LSEEAGRLDCFFKINAEDGTSILKERMNRRETNGKF
jgi:hypothetical protein